MQTLWEKVQEHPEEFQNQRVSYVLEDMRKEAIESVLAAFATEWCVLLEAITYAADRFESGDTEIPGLNTLKATANFDAYCTTHGNVTKFKYHQAVKRALFTLLCEEVLPLRDNDYRG